MADVFEAAARLVTVLNTPEPLDDAELPARVWVDAADLRAVLDARVEHLLEPATVERALAAAHAVRGPFLLGRDGSQITTRAMRAALLAAIGADPR